MDYLYKRRLRGLNQLTRLQDNSNTKKTYHAYSSNPQYIPVQGHTSTVGWKDSETNQLIKAYITIIKSQSAFSDFLRKAQNSNWSKFAVTFMPDETSIKYWDPFNDNRSEFVTNCPLTPYNFLFFYALYEQEVQIILESKLRKRMLFTDYIKYRSRYKYYNNQIDMGEEIYDAVREQMAYVIENNLTNYLEQCYKIKLTKLCKKKNIPLDKCEQKVPPRIKQSLYEACVDGLMNEKWNTIKPYFDKIYTGVLETIWERFKHLLNEDRFESLVSYRIETDYEDNYIIFKNGSLSWVDLPSIAAPKNNQGGLDNLFTQMKSFYASAMQNYYNKVKEIHQHYWPSFDYDVTAEMPDPEGEFLSGFSYILIFEPQGDALPYSQSHSPFPWFIIPYAQRKKIDCHYYDPRIVNGETFLYLVPLEYVIGR